MGGDYQLPIQFEIPILGTYYVMLSIFHSESLSVYLLYARMYITIGYKLSITKML